MVRCLSQVGVYLTSSAEKANAHEKCDASWWHDAFRENVPAAASNPDAQLLRCELKPKLAAGDCKAY